MTLELSQPLGLKNTPDMILVGRIFTLENETDVKIQTQIWKKILQLELNCMGFLCILNLKTFLLCTITFSVKLKLNEKTKL